jgi:4-hydroxybenzoate polyprenyltransferase
VDRDDDLKIGMKTSAITLGQWDVPVVAVFYLIYLLIWAVTPVRQAQTAIYFIAILIAGAQAMWHITLIRGRSREGCFKAFRLNHWLGFTVFLGLAISYAANPLHPTIF